MPLFKGEGCKSTPKSALAYITDEKKAAFVSSQSLDDSRDYAEQFRETAQLYGKGTGYDERKYYHFKLSCDRADNVSPEAHHEYAEAMAKRLFPNHECVIATHIDTDTVNSHIIVNSVNFENGKKLQINDSRYRRMKDLANDMGMERGFSKLNWREATRAKREQIAKGQRTEPQKYSKAEKYIQQEYGIEWDKHSWKEQLRQVIDGAKTECSSRGEFQKYLKEYGVEMPRNTEKSVSFVHPLVSHKSVRGNVLGAEYTATEIDKALNLNHERGIENAGHDIKQETKTDRTVEQAREQLRAVRAESPDKGLDRPTEIVKGNDTDLAIAKLNATIGESKAAVSRDDSAKRERIAKEQSHQSQRERAKSPAVHEKSRGDEGRER